MLPSIIKAVQSNSQPLVLMLFIIMHYSVGCLYVCAEARMYQKKLLKSDM